MLSVREPAQRAELVRRWRKQAFTSRAWAREIQQLQGMRLQGRPPTRPESVAEALRQTDEMARRWIMWYTNNLRKPQRRGGDAQTSSPTLAAFPSPQIASKWKVSIGGGYSGPTVADGRVYVTDRQVGAADGACIVAWDAKTGREKWRALGAL